MPTFKLTLEDNTIRRFTLEQSPDFFTLLGHIEALVGGAHFDRETCSLTYEDEDSDQCTVTSSEEFREAMRVFDGRVARFNVVRREPAVRFSTGPPAQPVRFYQTQIPYIGEYRMFARENDQAWREYATLQLSEATQQLTATLLGRALVLTMEALEDGSLSLVFQDAALGQARLRLCKQGSDASEGWFDATVDGPTITGFLFAPNGAAIQLRGMLTQKPLPVDYPTEQLQQLATVVPQSIEGLFSGGRILPNQIPQWLAPAIKLLPPRAGAPMHEMDLDVDLDKLFYVFHDRALELLTANQDLGEAVDLLQRCLSLKPQHAIAMYNLSCAHALAGDSEKAIDALARAINDCGYCKVEQILRDDDLRSLREIPKFQQLVHALREREAEQEERREQQVPNDLFSAPLVRDDF